MSKKVIDILWTGGWDSSYRMVELSREDVIVQPIYFYGDGRISEQYEKRAMSEIFKMLVMHPETIAEIRPIKYISVIDIPENKAITDAFKKLKSEINLGTQHEWLARYAYKNPGIELGTELAPLENHNVLKTIKTFGKLIYDPELSTYILDKNNSSKEIVYIIGNFNFPIIDKTGEMMLENIRSWGYEDIMQHVWVCHQSIFGKPCGICHPYELKIETDMKFLMSPASLKRYSLRRNKIFDLIFRVGKKLLDK